MKQLIRMSIALALGTGFLTGCPSADKAGPPFPDVTSFCVAKAAAECQIAPTCAVDPAVCATVREAKCNAEAAAATINGTRAYVPNNAQACIDAVTQVYGIGKVLLSDLTAAGSMGDTCARVFEGTVDKNKACTSDFECLAGRFCSPVQPGAKQLVCADRSEVEFGGFCANPGSVCASGSYCKLIPGGAAQCTSDAQAGEFCDAATTCVESHHCVANACTARQAPGQPCVSNDDCSPIAGFCDPYAGNICTVGFTFATGALDCHGYSGSTGQSSDAGSGDSSAPDAGGGG